MNALLSVWDLLDRGQRVRHGDALRHIGERRLPGAAVLLIERHAIDRDHARVGDQEAAQRTLAENVALGAPGPIDRERLRAALRTAKLDECVAQLRLGCEEPLGERGARLSGGQRQRLGIARALYRDASVLILDEPASALDEAAEREIIDALTARRAGRTVLIVAHRLSSLKHCDVVYELARGRIVRSGTAAQLSGVLETGA